MNHTNERIAKLWDAGVTDIAKIARKIGRPGPAGEERVVIGLRWTGKIPAPVPAGLTVPECCRVLGPAKLDGKKPPEEGPPGGGRKSEPE